MHAPSGTGEGGGATGRLAEEAVDPDVDLHVPAQRAETAGGRAWLVLTAVAAGGALGGVARYALSLALPARAGGFPWGIFLANVLGCALIGVLMVLVSEGGRAARTHPLVRPFLGVGVLGGFTTFSTYAAGIATLLDQGGPGAAGTALAYLAGTLAGALGAVWGAAVVTRAVLARRTRRTRRRGDTGSGASGGTGTSDAGPGDAGTSDPGTGGQAEVNAR